MSLSKLIICVIYLALGIECAFYLGAICGEKHERTLIRMQLEAGGAVGAPGNSLGISSTNYVVIEK